jgi:hypothetical protein
VPGWRWWWIDRRTPASLPAAPVQAPPVRQGFTSICSTSIRSGWIECSAFSSIPGGMLGRPGRTGLVELAAHSPQHRSNAPLHSRF